MRIIITADLHFDIARSQEPAREIAREICDLNADALLVLGDVAGREVRVVRDCLRLFERFGGSRFFVAGNHDIWTEPGSDSLERLEITLPQVCRESGFHPLDIEPAQIDGVSLVGSMGWYDYSFLPPEPRIPLRFYQAKIAPGAAERLPGYESLLERRDDVPAWAWDMGTRWMDGEHIHLPMSDEEFCGRLHDRLESHLEQASRSSRQIIVGLHHVPFRELVPLFSDSPRARELADNRKWIFTAPYMGGQRWGDLLLRYPKVTHAYCGHTHFPLQTNRTSLTCVNVGSTYLAKRYEVLEV